MAQWNVAAFTGLSSMRSLVTLRFLCPSTHHELRYQLQADAQTLVKRWSKTLKCRCPYCHCLHRFPFRAGYVDGMIAHVGQTADRIVGRTRPLSR
jgi:hypothetical protein